MAIDDIENTTCEELNNAHACILYKGHSKDKTLAGSYRTISTCPFVAKSLDYYIRDISIDDWHAARAETQFLGPAMSHELGALLLTETINHSIKDNNQPVFCLFLDARSAFDLTIREIMIRHLYLLGTNGDSLLYIDNRFKHRKTFMEWDRKVIGPIEDELGFEQGGISSGDFYTIYNTEQLSTTHEANLGIDIGPVQVSSIGQADDVVLLSHDVLLLYHLLTLTVDYCKKHHVTLAPEKTKLLVFSAPRHKSIVSYQKAISPIAIDGVNINFVTTAEHVGVIRSTDGNLPHIQGRIAAHLKSLYSVLPAGLARNQNANPAVSLRVQSVYSQPVLLSGIASLTLSDTETNIINSHHKNCLQNLMKLHQKTPESFILVMAGSLSIFQAGPYEPYQTPSSVDHFPEQPVRNQQIFSCLKAS